MLLLVQQTAVIVVVKRVELFCFSVYRLEFSASNYSQEYNILLIDLLFRLLVLQDAIATCAQTLLRCLNHGAFNEILSLVRVNDKANRVTGVLYCSCRSGKNSNSVVGLKVSENSSKNFICSVC